MRGRIVGSWYETKNVMVMVPTKEDLTTSTRLYNIAEATAHGSWPSFEIERTYGEVDKGGGWASYTPVLVS